ncbi:MAG: leucyl aminopeptidase, partial [Pseudomonadota bacterium]|nr:leucyl aminopeptidase [Pseudomonadota bacterium]
QVHTEAGPILVAGIGKGLDAGMSAETWGGRLYGQMKLAPFHQLRMDADLLPADIMQSVLNGALSASYYFDQYFTVKKDEEKSAELLVLTDNEANLAKDWDQQKALVDGVFTARDLLYEPANILYPDEFARRCKELESVGLDVQVIAEAELEKMGMGALLGVGQGSRRDSAVVVMNWQGGGDEAPVALVGKGVCFDTGGISLKPAKGMEDMKWDMGGAAAVTGAMHALAGRKVKRNVVGIIGLVENMPDGNAQRPGDVVTSMSGQTVEVINTDAEGRLVLADVLTYVQDTYKPQAIVDLATLTGAIIVSLGKEYAGLFSNNDQLAQAVSDAGGKVDEKCWRMPMGQAYDDMLKSHIADMKNIGGPYGGSITAACFLQRFIKDDTPWVHL